MALAQHVKLPFTTLDVFTEQKFAGNPLAIVQIPHDIESTVSQETKQQIAREFNLSETVFLHKVEEDGKTYRLDIFLTTAEIPFAGHPTIGTGWFILSQNPSKETITLRTKAGNIPVTRLSDDKVRLQVPTNFRIHPPFSDPILKAAQTNLTDGHYRNGLASPEPMVSIVKGMSFVLVELTSEDALKRVQLVPKKLEAPHIQEWAPFLGMYAFYRRQDGVIRTRMIEATLEDPATGSAASALGGYLGKLAGPGTHEFNILQGVEMGRPSEITVVVEIDSEGDILKIMLSGRAVEVMGGSLNLNASV